MKLLKPIHPFPARMAPEIVWKELLSKRKKLNVLDPMSGSGTTLVTANLKGHSVVGCDRDPLAVLISKSWLEKINPEEFMAAASKILSNAQVNAKSMKLSDGYPVGADNETKAFVRFWFDPKNRVQLAALSKTIAKLKDKSLRNVMWCAFSRLIITKSVGVSLAKDVSHSRPHKSYARAPINAFDQFHHAVRSIVKAAPFASYAGPRASAKVIHADARRLPIRSSSVDLVITSPPYLNAIDYLRGHKMSLVWMGHTIKKLRDIRSTNVGTEVSRKSPENDFVIEKVVSQMGKVENLSERQCGMLQKYACDMRIVLQEIKRVLKTDGRVVLVVGNCNLRNTFIENSKCIEALAKVVGMTVCNKQSRVIPDNHRYLPPPALKRSGKALTKRMREEVILTMSKN